MCGIDIGDFTGENAQRKKAKRERERIAKEQAAMEARMKQEQANALKIQQNLQQADIVEEQGQVSLAASEDDDTLTKKKKARRRRGRIDPASAVGMDSKGTL
jgi:Cdc6-like AAA superfamily ATPase